MLITTCSMGVPTLVAVLEVLSSQQVMIMMLQLMNMAHIFSKGHRNCAAFLTNFNSNSTARVMLNNMNYNLPPWSVSILSDCRNVVFNTAKLVEQDSEGHCNSECKTIKRACQEVYAQHGL